MGNPRVQVLLGGRRVPEALTGALRELRATASFAPLGEAGWRWRTQADAVVLVPAEGESPQHERYRRVLAELSQRPQATLVLDPCTGTRGALAPGAARVAYDCGRDTRELAENLRLLLGAHRPVASRPRPAAAGPFERYWRQIHTASQIQRELAPGAPPRCGRLSFSLVYQPVELVSGDMYEIRRIDAEHVGVLVADAVGHGLPAALLSLFVKRAMVGIGGGRSAAERNPAEVLSRLNGELLRAELEECEFVAATYAVVNTQTRFGVLARGGAPYPILRRRSGRLELIRSAGMLLGVQADVQFETVRFQLGAGDGLILYSDGVDCVALSNGAGARGATASRPLRALASAVRRLAASEASDRDDPSAWRAGGSGAEEAVPPDEWITCSRWCALLRGGGVRRAFEQARVRHDVLRRLRQNVDDLTLLAIQAEGR